VIVKDQQNSLQFREITETLKALDDELRNLAEHRNVIGPDAFSMCVDCWALAVEWQVGRLQFAQAELDELLQERMLCLAAELNINFRPLKARR